ncbi:MAG: hypothetical protein Q9197_002469 [Variospora fuerteventurae]
MLGDLFQEQGTHSGNASFDPYQRGRMAPPGKKPYFSPFELGKTITNSVIAKVLKSASVKFAEGDLVIGMISMVEYSVIPAEVITNGMMRKLENPYHLDLKLFLGALGMTGLTAYSSLYAIGEPKKGETTLYSSQLLVARLARLSVRSLGMKA